MYIVYMFVDNFVFLCIVYFYVVFNFFYFIWDVFSYKEVIFVVEYILGKVKKIEYYVKVNCVWRYKIIYEYINSVYIIFNGLNVNVIFILKVWYVLYRNKMCIYYI